MPELNILLLGDLNPELDNFLYKADSKRALIRRVWKGFGSVEDIMRQISMDEINTVILNPLTSDLFHPVNNDAAVLISEVRRMLPHQVVFVLYTDRNEASALLKEHAGVDVSQFIAIDPELEGHPDYFKHLFLALEKCDAFLHLPDDEPGHQDDPERQEGASAWRVPAALLLSILYLAAIYSTWNLRWLHNHPSRLGLYLCASIIVASSCLALLKREWQASALTVGAFGALLVIAQIIDGR